MFIDRIPPLLELHWLTNLIFNEIAFDWLAAYHKKSLEVVQDNLNRPVRRECTCLFGIFYLNFQKRGKCAAGGLLFNS